MTRSPRESYIFLHKDTDTEKPVSFANFLYKTIGGTEVFDDRNLLKLRNLLSLSKNGCFFDN